MQDPEDIGVAEAALAGGADLLVTHDLGDFESGPKAGLQTERVLSKQDGKAASLLVRNPLKGDLLAAIPEIAVGWLRGQMVPPLDIMGYRIVPVPEASTPDRAT